MRLPPLRDRTEDVGPLLRHFLQLHGGQPRDVEPEALALLQSHPWPGNVRQLESFVKNLVLFDIGDGEQVLAAQQAAALHERQDADQLLTPPRAQVTRHMAKDALNDPTIVDAHNQAVLRFAAIVTGGVEERFRYARQTGSQFWRDREAVLAEMQHWLEWWRDVAMMRHRLGEVVTNVEWNDLLSEIAGELKDAQIAAAVTAVQYAQAALEANAIPQLTLEVLMLDLPWVDAAKVPSLGG